MRLVKNTVEIDVRHGLEKTLVESGQAVPRDIGDLMGNKTEYEGNQFLSLLMKKLKGHHNLDCSYLVLDIPIILYPLNNFTFR